MNPTRPLPTLSLESALRHLHVGLRPRWLPAVLLATLAGLSAGPGVATAAAEAEAETPPDLGVPAVSTLEAREPTAPDHEAMPAEVAEAYDLETITPGQRGWGLSVFSGTEPERFEFEVIGVWRNNTPELSYVLARLEGQGLERSGVVAGMSGSPVFLDGRLVGAVAFSFPFGLDPIAGITPIDAMRRLGGVQGGVRPPLDLGSLAAPVSAEPAPAGLQTPGLAPAGLVPDLDALLRRDLPTGAEGAALLSRHLRLLQPVTSQIGAGRSGLQWTANGFGDAALDYLRRTFGEALGPSPPALGLGGARSSAAAPAMAGGASGSFGDGELRPGDSVALTLMQGDQSLAAHGTVTDRVGDRLVAFGHPVYSLGPTRLPMAESEVLTVISNAQSSFKLSNAGRLIGVFDQDREAGAHGVLGEIPEMTPVRIELRGLEERDYRLEIARVPIFRPSLTAMGALGALTSGSFSNGFQGIDLSARIDLGPWGELDLAQSFDGSSAAVDSVLYLLQYLAFLDFNTMEEVSIESVDVRLIQHAEPRSLALVSAVPERDRVAPGDTLGIRLELEPYRGMTRTERLEVEIPESIADGKYYLMIGDGPSIDAVGLSVEKRVAATFPQALELLRAQSPNTELHVLGLVAAPGLAMAGSVLPDLPGSARALLGPSGQAQPLVLRIADRAIHERSGPLSGVVRVDLDVRQPKR